MVILRSRDNYPCGRRYNDYIGEEGEKIVQAISKPVFSVILNAVKDLNPPKKTRFFASLSNDNMNARRF